MKALELFSLLTIIIKNTKKNTRKETQNQTNFTTNFFQIQIKTNAN